MECIFEGHRWVNAIDSEEDLGILSVYPTHQKRQVHVYEYMYLTSPAFFFAAAAAVEGLVRVGGKPAGGSRRPG